MQNDYSEENNEHNLLLTRVPCSDSKLEPPLIHGKSSACKDEKQKLKNEKLDQWNQRNRNHYLSVEKCNFRNDLEKSSSERRKELREALLHGTEVMVNQKGHIEISDRSFSISNRKPSDDARDKLRMALLSGEEVRIGQDFDNTSKKQNPQSEIKWYESNPVLLQKEVAQMTRHFPQFVLRKLTDGHICWIGTIRPEVVRKNATYILMLIYEKSHPICSTDGGTVRVYIIDPDLDRLNREIGGIPHLLYDEKGYVYLCTARFEDIQLLEKQYCSAAESLALAIKWISVFELWLSNEVSTIEFEGHIF